MTSHEISPEYLVLRFINEKNPDGYTVESIHANVRSKYVTKSQVADLIEEFKKREYVYVEKDKIKISDDGQVRLNQIQQVSDIENNLKAIRDNTTQTKDKVDRIQKIGLRVAIAALVFGLVQTLYTAMQYHKPTQEERIQPQQCMPTKQDSKIAPQTIQINQYNSSEPCNDSGTVNSH